MTDTTDTKALREAALKATKGEWRAFTDIRTGTCAVHTPEDKGCGDIVDWPGFDGAEGSKKQKVANAKYIAMANPQTIIAILDQLEAERQRADAVCRDIRIQANDLKSAQTVNKVLQAELAELKGDQVPVAWTDAEELRDMTTDGCAYLFKVDPANPFTDPRRQIMLYDRPQKPVVLPALSEERFHYYHEHLDITTFDESAYEAEVIAAIEATGGIVKMEAE